MKILILASKNIHLLANTGSMPLSEILTLALITDPYPQMLTMTNTYSAQLYCILQIFRLIHLQSISEIQNSKVNQHDKVPHI